MSGPLDFPPGADDERGPDDEAPAPAAPPAGPPTGGSGASVPRPSGASRYGWFVGVVVLLLIAWVSINALGEERTRATGVEPGTELPPFAAPLALGDLEGDANVAREAGSGDAGKVPACEVRGPDVLNVCQLAERGPVVLGFLATRGGDCTEQFDRLDRVRRGFPGVQVAVVASEVERDELRELIAERGWGFPVGVDADGAVAALYGVVVCPHLTFAGPDGRVRGTVLGAETEEQLRGRFRRLVAAARRQGWRPTGG